MKFEIQNLKFKIHALCGITIFQFFLVLNCLGQISQPARYEKEQKNSSHNFTIIPMGKQGLALVHDKQKYEGGNKFWEIVALDTALQESWTQEIVIENRYNFIGHDFNNGELFFLFRLGETESGSLKIFKIVRESHAVEQHNYEPQVIIRPTHFSVIENEVIFAGYHNSEPAVLLFNLNTDQGRIVPGLFGKSTELLDVRVNTNNTFNVMLYDRSNKINKKIVVRTFDRTGVLLLDDAFEVEDNKTILHGITSTLVRDELLIAGTWSEGVNTQAAGIFTALVDPFTEQKINFYDFPQLNHFLDYLSPKVMAKTKAKADRRRTQGKTPEFRVYASAVRLEETKEGFLFLSEAYHSPTNFNNNRYNPYNSPFYGVTGPYGFGYPYRSNYSPNYYNPYSSPYGNSSSANQITMVQASLVVFDPKGNLIADHGFKLEEIKTTSSDQISDFANKQGKISMVFSNEKEINYQVSQIDGMPLIKEKVTIQTKDPSESIRSEDGGIVRYWYEDILYIYGYQTIKDSNEKRDVFFINKIKVD